MNELLLIVSIAGSRVALAAAAVESVVELEAFHPVPRPPAPIPGLGCPRRSAAHARRPRGDAGAAALTLALTLAIPGRGKPRWCGST